MCLKLVHIAQRNIRTGKQICVYQLNQKYNTLVSMKLLLLLLVVLTIASQSFAAKKKVLKKIGINVKNCQASSVGNLDFMELWNAGCWRFVGGNCVFESPCKDKKNKKFNCKKNPGGFCKECNKCTCKGKKETCEVNIQPCKDQLEQSLNQGCFIGQKKKCQYVYPCPQEQCNDGDTKCEECNHCFCEGGNWVCTLKGCGSCPGDCWKKVGNTCVCNSICPGATPTFLPCNSGDTACGQCNTCRCGNNNWACTLKLCVAHCPIPCWGFGPNGCECKANIDCGTSRLPPGQCSDGDTTCLECNRCFCFNGSWTCTLIGCPQNSCPSNCWVLKGAQCVCQDFCK